MVDQAKKFWHGAQKVWGTARRRERSGCQHFGIRFDGTTRPRLSTERLHVQDAVPTGISGAVSATAHKSRLSAVGAAGSGALDAGLLEQQKQPAANGGPSEGIAPPVAPEDAEALQGMGLADPSTSVGASVLAHQFSDLTYPATQQALQRLGEQALQVRRRKL